MIINALNKTIQLKIVYYGPAMSGKTTSLKSLFQHFGREDKVESIESTVDRTLFFDFGTILFQNEKWKLKIHIYSTTGQDFYVVTRPMVLKGIDGIIFVVDSQKKVFERNLISWGELTQFFSTELFNGTPKVVAFNKQDLPEKFPTAMFLKEINFSNLKNISWNYTIALNGEGILESFEEILRLIFKNLYAEQYIAKAHKSK